MDYLNEHGTRIFTSDSGEVSLKLGIRTYAFPANTAEDVATALAEAAHDIYNKENS